jgi:hypothetical protein
MTFTIGLKSFDFEKADFYSKNLASDKITFVDYETNKTTLDKHDENVGKMCIFKSSSYPKKKCNDSICNLNFVLLPKVEEVCKLLYFSP